MHPAFMSDAIDDCREYFAYVARPRYVAPSPELGTVPTLQAEIPPHAQLPWHVFETSPRGGS